MLLAHSNLHLDVIWPWKVTSTGAHSKIAEKNTFGDVNAANEIVIDDETMLLHML